MLTDVNKVLKGVIQEARSPETSSFQHPPGPPLASVRLTCIPFTLPLNVRSL